jgi:tyrocidine synthetase III
MREDNSTKINNEKISGKIALAASQYQDEKEYWLEKLSGELVKTSFPGLHHEPGRTAQNQELQHLQFKLAGDVFQRLMKLGKQSDYTLHMILTAAVAALMNKYTANNDIIIGAPIYTQETQKEFLNTVLILRNQLTPGISFKQLLLQVRQNIMEANENQNYPVETLLYHLNIPQTGVGFPLFDTVVLLESIHRESYITQTQPGIIFAFDRQEDHIACTLKYKSHLYPVTQINQLAKHFSSLLETAIFNPDQFIADISILSPAEVQQVTQTFNDTATPYPHHETIHALFSQQAAQTPDKLAVICGSHRLSYLDLDQKSNRLATYLLANHVRLQEPVAIMAEDSIYMIIGVLGILKAGAAYMPLNPYNPKHRTIHLLKDANARFMLTLGPLEGEYAVQIIPMESSEIYADVPEVQLPQGLDSTSSAYIMHTSGSTGTPKGIIVQHRNVVRLVKNTNYIQFQPDDSILQTGALEFDASTFEIWGALLNGLSLYLAPKETILTPEKLKETLHHNRITTMWMTSPLFNQMVDADIDIFRHTKKLIVGGDALSPPHINRLWQAYPHIHLVNGYGPTENTTFSITHLIAKKYPHAIPIGKPIANSTAYIVDTNHKPQPIGVAGEIIIGGDGLAKGYLNNPEFTAERFVNDTLQNTNDKHDDSVHQHLVLYKTGDQGRWMPDGTIQFLGRIDQQVKIRGYRIEPGEIENHLESIYNVKEAVVTVRKNAASEKYLCAYIVSPQLIDQVEIKNTLANQLPEYMVPAYFVQVPELPLTSNGKVDRSALPEPQEAEAGENYVAPRSPLENDFARIWADVLGVRQENIGIDTNFFDLGGHSLKATILLTNLHKEMNIKLPLAELFRTPTIRELAEFIQNRETTTQQDHFQAITPAPIQDYYPLSSAQKRLYVMQTLNPEDTSFNVPTVMELQQEPQAQQLAESFNKMILRHESLRTSIQVIDGKPVQKIHQKCHLDIQYFKIRVGESGEVIGDFIRPFDLSQAPLMRVGIVNEEEERYILLVDLHHIITDGTSMEILVKEFNGLSKGQELPPLKLQYKDYAVWQNSPQHQSVIKEQEKYWLRTFAGPLPLLNLPLDHPRPQKPSFAGDTVTFKIGKEQTQQLNKIAVKEGATLYILLLAVYNILLAKLCNQEEIIIGTPIAARSHSDLQPIIGMFINVLAMRNFPRAHTTFYQFLQQVKENTIKAYENQDYQFDDLVAKLNIARDSSRAPLAETHFVLENMGTLSANMTQDIDQMDTQKSSEFNAQISEKMDLSLIAIEMGGGIGCKFSFKQKLFQNQTVQNYGRYFNNIIQQIIANPDLEIQAIELMSMEEKQKMNDHIQKNIQSLAGLEEEDFNEVF